MRARFGDLATWPHFFGINESKATKCSQPANDVIGFGRHINSNNITSQK